MKARKVVWSCVLMLGLLTTFSQAQDRAKFRKASISVGYAHGLSNLEYIYAGSFVIYDEYGAIGDGVDKANFPGFNISAGFSPSGHLEIFAGANFVKTNKMDGAVAFALPNMYIYDDIALAAATDVRAMKQTDILFGLKYRMLPGSKFNPYIGAGGCYASGKVPFVSDFTFTETFYGDDTHTIEINSLIYSVTKVSALGGLVVGGLEFTAVSSGSVYIEAAYKFAKKTVIHPMSDLIGTSDTVKIDLGGAILGAGFRYYF